MIVSSLPDKIHNAMEKVIGDQSIKRLLESGEAMNRYLTCRKAPTEKDSMKQKIREFAEMVESDPRKYKLPLTPPDESDEIGSKFYKEMKKQRVESLVRQRVYAWQSIEYDDFKSLVYLFGRAPQEYATLMRIFREIQKRDPSFQPRSFFDFGSGVGTGVWAASELWKSSIYEYYLVDSSKYMNDLSDMILRDGDVNKAMWLKNVNFRQFLPSRDIQYDLVLCAYTLFEQEDVKKRIEIANSLWDKSSKYLVFVENGTKSGFEILNEIREFLLQLSAKNKDEAFIFSPCPHESECPRVKLDDGTPCNFEVSYNSLPFSGVHKVHNHHYSYLVFKKGPPNETSDRWPRVVRPTQVRTRHSICRMCCSDGNIKDAIFTKAKNAKFEYRCARHIKWGDQYPANSIEFLPKSKDDPKILDE